MSLKKFLILAVLFVILTFGSCETNQSEQIVLDNLKESNMAAEYKLTDFNSVSDYFKGFNLEHIENFHYADLATVESSSDRIPGPTVSTIEGYFKINESEWNSYMDSYDWRDISFYGFSDYPDIPDIPDKELTWLRSRVWDDEHRGKGVSGRFYICKEKRLIYFNLFH